MFHRRSLPIWFVIFALFVVAGLAVFAARRDAITDDQSRTRDFSSPRPPGGVSRFRNLSFQPEAGKLSRRLGERFVGSDSDVSVLIGELVAGETRLPIRVIRKQDKRGESVEIIANERVLTWSAAGGMKANGTGPTEVDRPLIERITLDSPDAFILAQLRGATYQIVGKNVRADLGGADNYDGPLWTVVRVSHPDVDSDLNHGNSSRLYYINSRTGLIDKVVSEVRGEQVEATLDGWITEGGETFPSIVRWTMAGRQIMEFRVSSFARSGEVKEKQ